MAGANRGIPFPGYEDHPDILGPSKMKKSKKIEGPHFNSGCYYKPEHYANGEFYLVRRCLCTFSTEDEDEEERERHFNDNCHYKRYKDVYNKEIYLMLKCYCKVSESQLV
ncbi:hypothetical protein EB796_018719 [Bugula neritina]|uniref:Uncharacterized protein n=1 Tax=Bugula neritina TaxID=10212 RepID=A0A7J7JAE6_BUGNE|nr:hypothetical protein EB796_018719 [Bugula neritina]